MPLAQGWLSNDVKAFFCCMPMERRSGGKTMVLVNCLASEASGFFEGHSSGTVPSPTLYIL